MSAVAGDPATHPALERFLRSLAARDASPHTIRAYDTAVGAYLAWLAERGVDWRRPTAAGPARATSPSSAARRRPLDRRPAARGDPLVPPLGGREGLAAGDPWGAIATPRLPRRLPARPRGRPGRRGSSRSSTRSSTRPRQPGPIGSALATALALRDRALVETAYAAGLRISELAAADLGVARPAAGRDPGHRQGPQGTDRAAGAAGARGADAYLDHGRPILARPAAPRGRRRIRRRPRSSSTTPARRSASAGCATGSTGCAAAPACRRASRRTRSATRSRPTCSTAARTCASSRSCSATRASRRPRSTRTSRPAAWRPPTATRTRERGGSDKAP